MIPQFHSKRMENIWPNKNLYINVHSSLIHNSQKVGTTCPSTDKWIKKMWNIIQPLKYMNYWYTLQHGWILQMLTERNQTWKTTYCVIPRVRTVQNRHIFRDRKQTNGYLGLGEGNGGWLLMGMRFLLGWWNVQNSDMVMGAQHCECTKNTELYTLKNMNFMRMWTVSQ